MALVTPCIGAASILAKTLTDDADTYCNFVKLPEILDILIDLRHLSTVHFLPL